MYYDDDNDDDDDDDNDDDEFTQLIINYLCPVIKGMIIKQIKSTYASSSKVQNNCFREFI
jgi:hypothetical protein